MVFFTPFYATFLFWNFDFSGAAYHRDSKPALLDLTCLKPYICTTQAILMHFSQSKSLKCKIFGCLLNYSWQEIKKYHFKREKVFQKAWKSAHIGFWVCWLQCTMLEFCVTSTFWVMMVFSWFLRGRFRYMVLRPGVGVELGPRSIAA